MLDGEATTSAGGINPLEHLQQHYLKEGTDFGVETSPVEFTFADGERTPARSKVIAPMSALSGTRVGIHAIPTPTPALVGLDLHDQLGCVIHYRYGTCRNYELGRFVEVTRLPSNYLGPGSPE